MKKSVKITIISLAALAVIAGILFVVIPLVTSKEAETRLNTALADAGIPEDMWSIDRAYYIPLFNNLVAEKFELGERDSGTFLEVKKIILTLGENSGDIFAGSVDARELSFSAADTSITVRSFSLNDFSVDKALFKYSPVEAVKKLKAVRLNDAVFMENDLMYFSLGTIDADIGYTEGKIPLSSSISLKELTADIRHFAPLPTLRPEYRFSKLELKSLFSNDVYGLNLDIDGKDLFTLKTEFGISLPHEIFESGEIANLTRIDYDEDVKIASLLFTYTDKSFLDHVFELAGMSGGREAAAEQLTEIFDMIAMMSGIDTERFSDEAANFIIKPEKLEIKTNLNSPVSFGDISQDPFAINLSLSINGGKPFTTNAD